jgi:hypothetical protein
MRPGMAECFGNHKCGSAGLGCTGGDIDLAGRGSVFGRSGWELASFGDRWDFRTWVKSRIKFRLFYGDPEDGAEGRTVIAWGPARDDGEVRTWQ